MPEWEQVQLKNMTVEFNRILSREQHKLTRATHNRKTIIAALEEDVKFYRWSAEV